MQPRNHFAKLIRPSVLVFRVIVALDGGADSGRNAKTDSRVLSFARRNMLGSAEAEARTSIGHNQFRAVLDLVDVLCHTYTEAAEEGYTVEELRDFVTSKVVHVLERLISLSALQSPLTYPGIYMVCFVEQ